MPPDAPQLLPAIRRSISRTGKPHRAVTVDHGYGETSAAHHGSVRRLIKWRIGSGSRIITLKCDYGWDRNRPNGIDGARIWCGPAVFAQNHTESQEPSQLTGAQRTRPDANAANDRRPPTRTNRLSQIEVAMRRCSSQFHMHT
ncbi:hypothetical protein GCM10025762_15130 [Haloechinothrix salitolerans]